MMNRNGKAGEGGMEKAHLPAALQARDAVRLKARPARSAADEGIIYSDSQPLYFRWSM